MGRRAITPETIIKRDGLRCHYCEQFMNVYHGPLNRAQNADKRRFTFEHIVPKSQGGTWGLYNIVGACSGCNNAHGNRALKCFCLVCQAARVRFEMREMRLVA